MRESISTNNINEATYYILCGGEFVSASEKIYYIRKYRVHSQPKMPFHKWHIHIKNIPVEAIDCWWKGIAIWDIRDFMDARELLKKRIVMFLHGENIDGIPVPKKSHKC